MTQILREINFEESRSAKTTILTCWKVLNFDFSEFLHFLQDEIYQINKVRAFKIAKSQFQNFLILLNLFHVNLFANFCWDSFQRFGPQWNVSSSRSSFLSLAVVEKWSEKCPYYSKTYFLLKDLVIYSCLFTKNLTFVCKTYIFFPRNSVCRWKRVDWTLEIHIIALANVHCV